MLIVNIITGLFLILVGFAVKKYPDLIAGYNTMSPERKEKVDIDGLSTFMKKGFIAMGVLTILAYFLLAALDYPKLADGIMVITIVPGTILMAILAQRYDKGRGA